MGQKIPSARHSRSCRKNEMEALGSGNSVAVYNFRCLRCGYDAPVHMSEAEAECDLRVHVHDESLRQWWTMGPSGGSPQGLVEWPIGAATATGDPVT